MKKGGAGAQLQLSSWELNEGEGQAGWAVSLALKGSWVGRGGGKYSLHAGEVSEKYHASSLENLHTKEVNSLIPELQPFKKIQTPEEVQGRIEKCSIVRALRRSPVL